jgi:hypothetical protein
LKVLTADGNLWQIKTTLMHWHGRAALPRRLLADRQVSPAELAFVPMLIEIAIVLAGCGFFSVYKDVPELAAISCAGRLSWPNAD